MLPVFLVSSADVLTGNAWWCWKLKILEGSNGGRDLCDPLEMGLERKGQGDHSSFSVTNLPRNIGDWLLEMVGLVCVHLQPTCCPGS